LMPRKARVVSTSLTKKGFTAGGGDHEFYRLFIEGKNTGIRTKISHGEKEIHDGLLGQMAKDTRLSKREFLELVDCSLKGDAYVSLLRDRGDLPRSENGSATGA
jgi:predicted RNA binding protein YcfA (HicA-like mRNA interferase family)